MAEDLSQHNQTSAFPLQIIPAPYFVKEMERCHLNELNVWLQRACPAPLNECCKDGDPDNVVPEAFGSINTWKKMSVNLLGAHFEIGHECWIIKKPACDPWMGEVIDPNSFLEYIVYVSENYPSVYFTFIDADTLKWTFPRTFPDQATFDNQKDKIIDAYKDKLKFVKGQDYKIPASSKCSHVPTRMNYWHCEVHTFIEANPKDEDVDKIQSYRKTALREMVEILRKNCTLSPPEQIPLIKERLYSKGL